MEVKKRGRYWAVFDDRGKLVCVAIYRKGVLELIRRLTMEGSKDNVYKMEKYR